MVKRAKRVSATRQTEPQINAVLERYFGLSQQGTDIRTEFVAGVTTFLTMVYIVFVNPIILGKAGMDPGAVFVATCVAAAVSTLVSDRACARDGYQRIFRLHGRAHLQIHVATGAGRRVLFRRAVLSDFSISNKTICH
jgi:uncharacterized membrane protein